MHISIYHCVLSILENTKVTLLVNTICVPLCKFATEFMTAASLLPIYGKLFRRKLHKIMVFLCVINLTEVIN